MSINAVAFDLGDTLISYNVPLSWESLYDGALKDVLNSLGRKPQQQFLIDGKRILSKYNTRKNPRFFEVKAEVIFSEIYSCWKIDNLDKLYETVECFFNHFQRNIFLYDDSIECLKYLKQSGVKTGIITDVPYGMATSYVKKDIIDFDSYIDYLITSVDVGFRKPSINGYKELLNKLDISKGTFLYVGNEEKDIVGANEAGYISVLIDREKKGYDYGQKYTISSLLDLKDIIKNF